MKSNEVVKKKKNKKTKKKHTHNNTNNNNTHTHTHNILNGKIDLYATATNALYKNYKNYNSSK
jgi:hypothetical protein